MLGFRAEPAFLRPGTEMCNPHASGRLQSKRTCFFTCMDQAHRLAKPTPLGAGPSHLALLPLRLPECCCC